MILPKRCAAQQIDQVHLSPLRQTRKSDCTIAMSAFPPLATRQRTSPKVRFVPLPDSCIAANCDPFLASRRRHAAAFACKRGESRNELAEQEIFARRRNRMERFSGPESR